MLLSIEMSMAAVEILASLHFLILNDVVQIVLNFEGPILYSQTIRTCKRTT
jgi:hypothetical protein